MRPCGQASMSAVLGLDLSATAAAGVVVPCDWDGRWATIASIVVGGKLCRGASDAERARRTEAIATELVAFARDQRASIAFIESYAFSRKTAAHTLAEVGGVVRLELLRAGLEIRTAPIGTARKLLLGRIPRSDIKAAVVAAVRAAGGRFESFDEADAFVAANYGLSELGGFCFAQAVAA